MLLATSRVQCVSGLNYGVPNKDLSLSSTVSVVFIETISYYVCMYVCVCMYACIAGVMSASARSFNAA